MADARLPPSWGAPLIAPEHRKPCGLRRGYTIPFQSGYGHPTGLIQIIDSEDVTSDPGGGALFITMPIDFRFLFAYATSVTENRQRYDDQFDPNASTCFALIEAVDASNSWFDALLRLREDAPAVTLFPAACSEKRKKHCVS